MAQALRDWHRGVGPLPDLIAVQDGLNQVIGPPLSRHARGCTPLYAAPNNRHLLRPHCFAVDEVRTLIEAMWKREADSIHTDFERGWPNNTIREPRVFQQMALTHLLNGGKLRAGDFTVLHGSLLTGMQPNTFALATKWEQFMDCVGPSKAAWCSYS